MCKVSSLVPIRQQAYTCLQSVISCAYSTTDVHVLAKCHLLCLFDNNKRTRACKVSSLVPIRQQQTYTCLQNVISCAHSTTTGVHVLAKCHLLCLFDNNRRTRVCKVSSLVPIRQQQTSFHKHFRLCHQHIEFLL